MRMERGRMRTWTWSEAGTAWASVMLSRPFAHLRALPSNCLLPPSTLQIDGIPGDVEVRHFNMGVVIAQCHTQWPSPVRAELPACLPRANGQVVDC